MEIPARATIANMGAEMGATTSIFPADAQVKRFLAAQGRPEAYTELLPDEDAEYDETIDINLSELEPLIACPHQPDNVMPLHQAEKKRVQQVFIGSCTNASYADIAKAALVFKGHHVNEDVSCTCAVSSNAGVPSADARWICGDASGCRCPSSGDCLWSVLRNRSDSGDRRCGSPHLQP